MNLKELSETLGLSQTTVSRALNGYPEVSESTRVRVVEAAARFDYRPNANATRLATGKSYTIGHVIPVASRHHMVNPVFADFLAGASETYMSRRYDLKLSVVSDEIETDAYRRMVETGSVDGFIVHGPLVCDARIGLLKEIGLPFVVHGRSSGETSEYSWLDINNASAFDRATSYLLETGHRRIGLINGLEDMDFAHRRRRGYTQALSRYNVEADIQLMRSDEMTEPYGLESVLDMMRLDDPPTAFLASSILSAIGARRAVQELGLRLGHDISIVTFDDNLSYLQNSGETPMFTATRSSVKDAGRRCAELLLELVRNPDAAPQTELWEAVFVIGISTGSGPFLQ